MSCGLLKPFAKSLTSGSPLGFGRTSTIVPAEGRDISRFPSGVTAMKRALGTRAYTAMPKSVGTVRYRGVLNGDVAMLAGTCTCTDALRMLAAGGCAFGFLSGETGASSLQASEAVIR